MHTQINLNGLIYLLMNIRNTQKKHMNLIKLLRMMTFKSIIRKMMTYHMQELDGKLSTPMLF